MPKTQYSPVNVFLSTLCACRPDVFQEQKDNITSLLKVVRAGNYCKYSGWVLYFFINKKHREVDYVGITGNLSRRMPQHEKLNTNIHDILIIETCDEYATKELEKLFIRDFQPILNTYY